MGSTGCTPFDALRAFLPSGGLALPSNHPENHHMNIDSLGPDDLPREVTPITVALLSPQELMRLFTHIHKLLYPDREAPQVTFYKGWYRTVNGHRVTTHRDQFEALILILALQAYRQEVRERVREGLKVATERLAFLALVGAVARVVGATATDMEQAFQAHQQWASANATEQSASTSA